jgi:hypothetical protein
MLKLEINVSPKVQLNESKHDANDVQDDKPSDKALPTGQPTTLTTRRSKKSNVDSQATYIKKKKKEEKAGHSDKE